MRAQCAQEGGREVVGIFHMIPKFDVIFFVESGHTRGKTYFWDIQRIFNVFLSDFFLIFQIFFKFYIKNLNHDPQ